MLDMLNKIMSLPGRAKVGAGLAGAVVLIGAVAMFSPKLAPILLLGLAVVVLALGLYKAVLKWADKRKAKPFERKLAENAGAAPMGVGDAARRARLDDMRRKFEEGVATFREHGKDLYSLPWYLLVGEPGSGKTEAIRHCNVGFPPGLQDQLQGAGGTLNMNWWFTNHAVILDTAGRLMFEEVEPGKSSEWKEFLKLLRAARPNCPVNGLLLVIPADSLIADTADAIHRKAGRIAEQLDAIQRLLGVRFPVFVVITKCDLINGFREFFRDLNDPQMQHQMLGWSNPADLDAPFRADAVEQHLKSVTERLKRRRMGLLLDPVHTEDPIGGRRTDEVDALYAFPDALLKIGPRLKMYLEMIFQEGEWATKPLFLRGMYFTSSMQEGAELDAELADALGVDVKSLPEGKGFTRNSSYFLRDLFMGKVFREKGLVTSASNARRQQRRRRMAVMGAGVAGTLGLMGATVFADREYKRAIGTPAGFWEQVANVMAIPEGEKWEIVVEDDDGLVYYEGHVEAGEEGKRVKVDGKNLTKAQLAVATRERAQEEDETPLMFRPIAGVTGGDVFARERDAHQRVLELTVLEPAVVLAASRVQSDAAAGQWSAEASGALRQLLRLKAAQHEVTPAAAPGAPIEIKPLIDYLVGHSEQDETDEDRAQRATDLASLQEVINWTYGSGDEAWPPESEELALEYAAAEDPLILGARQFVEYWKKSPTAQGRRLENLKNVQQAIEGFERAESALKTQVAFGSVQTVAEYEERRSVFQARFAALREAKTRLDAAVGAVGEGDLQSGMRALVTQAVDEVSAQARREYKALTDELPAAGSEDEAALETPLKEVRSTLVGGQEDLTREWTSQRDALAQRLEELSGKYLVRVADGRSRPYERRFAMYEAANRRLDAVARLAASGDIFGLQATLGRADQDAAGAAQETTLADAEQRDADLKAARDFAQEVIAAANRRERHDAMQAALGGLRGDRSIADLVADQVEKLPALERDLRKPVIPMTGMASGGGFDARYHPMAARRILDAVGMMKASVAGGGASAAPLDVESIARAARDVDHAVARYRDEYVAYWTDGIDAELEIRAPSGPGTEWERAVRGVQEMTFRDAMDGLKRLVTIATGALTLPTELDTQEARRGRERLTAMREAMENPDYARAVRDVLDEWRSVREEAEEAKEDLLDLSPQDFVQRYLNTDEKVYGESSERASVAYWSNLIEFMMESLADECERESRTAWDRIRLARNALPLCADSTKALDRAGIMEAFAEVDLIRASGAPATEEGAGRMLREGQRLKPANAFARANQRLNRMQGMGALASSADRQWVNQRLAPVVEFLRGSDPRRTELPTWEFVSLRQDSRVKTIRISGAGLNGEYVDDASRGGETGIRLPLHDAQGLRLEFFDRGRRGEDFAGAATGQLNLATGWTILPELLQGDVERVTEPGFENVWAVPVTFEMGGAPVTYLIGVRFDKRVLTKELLEAWPTSRDWPRGQ